jgi:4-amino-4-deoxy-L-arabinose transferase-like glycosyltransferase
MRTQAVEHQEPVRAPEPRVGGVRHDGSWLRERIEGRWALVVGLAWLVLFEVAGMFEPQTSHEEPVIGVVIAVVMWTLIATMVTGLAMQRRWGLGAALAAGVFLSAAVIACPTTGHHTFGTWWYGEALCTAAIVGVSAYALQRAPRVEPEPDPEIS